MVSVEGPVLFKLQRAMGMDDLQQVLLGLSGIFISSSEI